MVSFGEVENPEILPERSKIDPGPFHAIKSGRRRSYSWKL